MSECKEDPVVCFLRASAVTNVNVGCQCQYHSLTEQNQVLYPSLFLNLFYARAYTSKCAYLIACLPGYLPVVYLPASLSLCFSACLPTCLSACLPTQLLACLPIFLPAWICRCVSARIYRYFTE